MNKMKDIFVAPKRKSHMHALSSFCQNPTDVSFQTQKPHETIILFLRSHFIKNISWIIFAIILSLLPLAAALILPLLKLDFLSSEAASRFVIVLTLLYYLLVFSYAFISFLHWFYNVLIVTSERVVDIDYSDIVIHNIAVASLSHVEDVNYDQSGFISTYLNYGNLFIQTAGDKKNLEAYSIPSPREATHIIGDLTGKGHSKSE